jgi:hypothetical protein
MLNGLADFSPAQRILIFKDLFQFLLRKELTSLEQNHFLFWSNQGTEVLGSLPTSHNDFDLLFMLGLALETQRESNAMKFLACDGEALPVFASDGLGFKEVVRLHLERFYSLQLGDIVLRSTLCRAWPPSASNYDSFDDTNGIFPNHPASDKDHQDEVKLFCSLVVAFYAKHECANMHVVIKQDVDNAQGPDVYVLTFEGKNNVYLDLYQVKNRNILPSNSELVEWLCSLGLFVAFSRISRGKYTAHILDKPEDIAASVVAMKTRVRQKNRKNEKKLNENKLRAAYMLQGINLFAQQLSESLKKEVKIRNRYLVIQQSGDTVATAGTGGFLRALVENGNVRVWTRDFLEPTFSAIPSHNKESVRNCTVSIVSLPTVRMSLDMQSSK